MILEKIDISNIRTMTILSGGHVERVQLKRMHKLINEGLVMHKMNNGHMVYALTRKGLAELAIDRTPTELRGYSVEHTEKLATVASWLYMATGRSIFDIDFARQIKKYPQYDSGKVHIPDIVFSNTCVELELNRKADNRLEKNFKDNADLYVKQIWIIPKHKKGLESALRGLAKKYNCEVDIRFIERIESTVKNYNLTANEPRFAMTKPDKTPHARFNNKRRIEFDD